MQYLALMLDAPLQSWGFASRFQRRTTGLHPTKSGVVGLLCAALGAAKGSASESEWLPKLAALRLTVINIPRLLIRNHNSQSTIELPMQRMEDFHTVGAGYDADRDWQFMPRSAQGKTLGNPVVTHRQYLLDARFGLLLAGEPPVLSPVADAVRNPVWGVWFGRKCCIPAAPIYRAGPCDEAAAWRALINDTPRDQLTQVTEVDRFEDGSDTLNDQPLSFGAANSSGPEARRFAPRRIRVIRGL